MSLDFDIEYPMQSLYIAKIFYDHNRLDTLLDCLDDDITISWDELSQLEQTAVGCIFADSRYHYQPEKYIDRDHYRSDQDVYVLRDPLLTRYDNLCRRLEAAEGITKVENPFAKDLESAIHRQLRLSSYCYDYRWIDSTQDKKGAKLVLFLFEEFGVYYDLIEALFSILDFCEETIPKLESRLAKQVGAKVIRLPVPAATEKEAA